MRVKLTFNLLLLSWSFNLFEELRLLLLGERIVLNPHGVIVVYWKQRMLSLEDKIWNHTLSWRKLRLRWITKQILQRWKAIKVQSLLDSIYIFFCTHVFLIILALHTLINYLLMKKIIGMLCEQILQSLLLFCSRKKQILMETCCWNIVLGWHISCIWWEIL